jgi:hypothetical protein
MSQGMSSKKTHDTRDAERHDDFAGDDKNETQVKP